MTAKKKGLLGEILEGGIEATKDSVSQIAETVSPENLVDQTMGSKKSGSEVTDYLRNLHPDLSAQELENRTKELSENDRKKQEEVQKVLRQAGLPKHLRPTGKREKSEHEKNTEEEEMKKAKNMEAQKKKSKIIAPPKGKVTGLLGGKRRPISKDFEAGKDIKTG